VHDDGTPYRVLRAERTAAVGEVQDRSQVAKRPPRRKAVIDHRRSRRADAGTIATVNVLAGHAVARATWLVTMKLTE